MSELPAQEFAACFWVQAYDEGKAGMFESTPPVVNYVIEASAHGKEWFTWDFVPHSDMITADENEVSAKERWRRWLPGGDHRQGLRFRLVKRTAFIHDEILDTDNPEA